MTPHAQHLNDNLRTAGVVWHECTGCGRDWPFPNGPDEPPRDWHCGACANALWASLQRAKAAV